MTENPNILGKDYLTEVEAAYYAGVSLSQFRAKAESYDLKAGWFMGKKVYRKTDIQRAIERSWPASTSAAGPGTSSGSKRARSAA